MEKQIIKFYKKLYIPEIKIILFHLPHVRILRTHKYGK